MRQLRHSSRRHPRTFLVEALPAEGHAILNADENNPTFMGAAKAGFKKMDEREIDLSEFDGFDFEHSDKDLG